MTMRCCASATSG